jgi:hypothetical protein
MISPILPIASFIRCGAVVASRSLARARKMFRSIDVQRKDFQTTISKLEATIARQQKDSQSTAAQQQKEIQALSASLKQQASQFQKVSTQLEASKPAPQVVNNP